MSTPAGVETSDPAIREYITLTRLQVLTPLSLLLNVATYGLCLTVVNPNISRIAEMYPTSISPSMNMFTIYVAAIFITQVGYCILLVGARREDTRQALIKGSGYELVVANWVMVFWLIAWILQWFTLAAVLVGILTAILLYANLVLLTYHPPDLRRPMDILLLHMPVRLFLVLPFTIGLPYMIFIAIHHYWPEGSTTDYDKYGWEGFAALLASNLIGLIVIATQRDVVWTIAATWLAASVWKQGPKSAQVSVTALVFMIAHPVIMLATMVWYMTKPKRTGPVALPPDVLDDTEA